MHHVMDSNDFRRFVNSVKSDEKDNTVPYAWFLVRIADDYLPDLTPYKSNILMFIASKTLKHSKRYAGIYSDEFLRNVGISAPTMRRCLGELCEDGLIDVVSPVNGMERQFKDPRYYAINGNRFPRKSMSFLKQPKAARVQAQVTENDGEGREEKVAPVVTNLKVRHVVKTKTLSVAPATPSTERVSAAQAVIAQVQARAATKPSAAPRAASTRLTMPELQSILDERTRGTQHPRVIVTSKPFGVLRKRIEERGDLDLPEFVAWLIGYWHQTASRSIAAAEKSKSSYKPLSRAPNFDDMAYRFPYFVTVYESFRAERKVLEDPRDAKIRKLEAIAKAAIEENVVLKRARRATPALRQAPSPVAEVESDYSAWDDDERQVG